MSAPVLFLPSGTGSCLTKAPCGPPCADCRCKDNRAAPTVFDERRNAVVNILTFAVVFDPAVGVEEPVFMNGTGFFVAGARYILTAAHLVLLDPLVEGPHRVPPPPPDNLVRVQRIFVSVFGINGNPNQNVVYEAKLVGVDGAGDVAVLRIDPTTPMNTGLPAIDPSKQASLRWGRSRDYLPGNPAFLIGDALGADYRSFSAGVVRNNRYMPEVPLGESVSGVVVMPVHECILLTTPAFGGNSGGPVLDCNGCLLGLLTTNFSQLLNANGASADPRQQQPSLTGTETFVGGPSQFFIEPVVETIIDVDRKYPNALSTGADLHLAIVPDSLGPYLKYVKGYLGLSWVAVTAASMLTAVTPNGCNTLEPETIARALQPLPFSGYDQLQGVVVSALDGFPGDTCHRQTGAVSPLVAQGLVAGDIITTLDAARLGNIQYAAQVAPSVITWRHLPGEAVLVQYRRVAEQFARDHNAIVTLLPFPYTVDYPLSGHVAIRRRRRVPRAGQPQRAFA